MIWGDISRSLNGENVLGGVAYKNKYLYHDRRNVYINAQAFNNIAQSITTAWKMRKEPVAESCMLESLISKREAIQVCGDTMS